MGAFGTGWPPETVTIFPLIVPVCANAATAVASVKLKSKLTLIFGFSPLWPVDIGRQSQRFARLLEQIVLAHQIAEHSIADHVVAGSGEVHVIALRHSRHHPLTHRALAAHLGALVPERAS